MASTMLDIGSPEWINSILNYDPDADAKGHSGVRKISDRVVVARKPGQCATCFGAIAPGSFVRREKAVVDGRMVSIRHCTECCDAMSKWPDPAEPLEARYELGIQRSKTKRNG